jgi:hypothetical protein
VAHFAEIENDLATIIAEEGIEVNWNELRPTQPTTGSAFRAIQSDNQFQFVFTSGGYVRGADFFLVALRKQFTGGRLPRSGDLVEVPTGSGIVYRILSTSTSETDPAIQMDCGPKDSVQ